MNLLQPSVGGFFLLFILHSLLSGAAQAHQVTFYIKNKCPFPIWPATAPNTGHPVIAEGGFFLASGQTQRIDAPWDWSGRFWARTNCNFNNNDTNWQSACETGDCDGRLACNGLIGKPPVTLLQLSLQSDKTKPNFYDISLVDGYNLPISITNKEMWAKCTVRGCSKSLISSCPDELQVVNKNGEVVACKSACLAFNVDSFCCRNEYARPDKCKPNIYSNIFKEACPNYYSYAFDSPPPLVNCASKEYVVTFCPSSWGAHHQSMHHQRGGIEDSINELPFSMDVVNCKINGGNQYMSNGNFDLKLKPFEFVINVESKSEPSPA